MEKVKRPAVALPYSLHDAIISKIELCNDVLTFSFKEGFYTLKDELVKGQVVVEGLLEGTVMLLENQGRKVKGEKMSLKKFLKNYGDYEIEILEELYAPLYIRWEGLMEIEEEDYYVTLSLISKEMTYILDEKEEPEVEAVIIEEEKSPTYQEEQFESPYKSWQEKVLVVNTTFDERRKIVEMSLEGDVTCAGDDVLAQMYEDYIDGKIELADINKEYMRQMGGE